MKRFYVFIDKEGVLENNLNDNINVTQTLFSFFLEGEGNCGRTMSLINIMTEHFRTNPNSFKRFRTLMSCDAAVPIFFGSVFFCVSEFFRARGIGGRKGCYEICCKKISSACHVAQAMQQ